MKRNRMEGWKKEYDEIPVPQDAVFCTSRGIKKAKQELYQRLAIKILRNTGTAAAALVVLMAASALGKKSKRIMNSAMNR